MWRLQLGKGGVMGGDSLASANLPHPGEGRGRGEGKGNGKVRRFGTRGF